MDKMKIDDIIRYLKDARDRLPKARDKRQYYLTLLELKILMDELEDTLTVADLRNKEYAAVYNGIFTSKEGASEYDRVCNYLDTHTDGSLYHRIF